MFQDKVPLDDAVSKIHDRARVRRRASGPPSPKARDAEERTSRDETHSYRSVLCATDLSATGDAAVRVAYGLTAPGGTVFLLHVYDHGHWAGFVDGNPAGSPPTAREFKVAVEKHARERLALLPSRASRPDVTTKEILLHHDDPATAIASHAKRHEVDVVVLGTHGRTGLGRLWMGSVAMDVLKRARTPIVLFHDPAIRDRP
jgi:nucleotide-binding universal stress UspA family protein